MTILKQIPSSTISSRRPQRSYSLPASPTHRQQHGQRQQRIEQQHGHNDGHFESNDRSNLQQHYQSSARTWANKPNRPSFSQGQAIPRNYRMQSVPASYWHGAPPPSGYSYGYYDGYVVSYNPTTRIIADVLDRTATGK